MSKSRISGRHLSVIDNGTAKENPMKFVLVIYESPANFDARHDANRSRYVGAWRAYYKALVDAGVYVGGAPLKEVATATTVRLKDGKRHVQDGPFAEGKEQLGGFILLELPSLDAALDWAARCPAASSGALEVRPMEDGLHDAIVAE
jgi:hypothetical protein